MLRVPGEYVAASLRMERKREQRGDRTAPGDSDLGSTI